MSEPVLLASGSATRIRLMTDAGLVFDQCSPRVDEEEAKVALKADGTPPASGAEILAELKARQTSISVPGTLVIGADQILSLDGRWFDKPADRDAAYRQLWALRGTVHALHTAVVVCKEGERLWHHTDTVRLWVRDFSEAFLEDYLDTCGDTVLSSVGGYQIEGRGVQLFSRIEGDYFSIMGLPLPPLLQFLRLRGVLMS